ncbi:rhomboid family intramembrane serine protease [Amnibacterium kyonggiense]|uniref:Membrane associated rhomboid family serine protease n=1 Tax=Amnibacterium kyonggiense TaxID=595671 RepID=A0A4V3EB02_9MICO|nr:rhomboid family intramembrane serine protease [Amnibacterium kyonggiense]TDS79814.1 membrane associated rhomboid family serine protease [Amnibacterium kyonggiense]
MSDVRADLRRVWRRSARYRPRTATGWIAVVTVAAYIVQLLTAPVLENALLYAAVYSLPSTGAPFEPWRMLTSALIHQPIAIPGSIIGLTHIAFNMIALVSFGRPLEHVIGAPRLVAIYLIGALGGSVGVLYAAFFGLIGVNTGVYGASGAVFAVLGAVAVVQRRLGIDVRMLVVLIAVNLALGFVVSGIAWQAHVGGLVVGAATGWLFVANRGPRRDARARIGAVGITTVLLALALVPAAVV